MSQLKWRCRRGMKELDVLLTGYLEQTYPDAPTSQQQAFADLLTCPDPDLYRWLIQGQALENADAARLAVVECLRQRAR